jgi:hypothetical protein
MQRRLPYFSLLPLERREERGEGQCITEFALTDRRFRHALTQT